MKGMGLGVGLLL